MGNVNVARPPVFPHLTPRPAIAESVSLGDALLNAAADLESELHKLKLRERALAKQVHWADKRQDWTRRCLLALRTSLRNDSHAKTTKLLKRILVDLNTQALTTQGDLS